MNRSYLEDYQAKEDEAFQKYTKDVLDQGIVTAGYYPSMNRFSKIRLPAIICDRSVYMTYREKIWSQVPFAGTLLIPLDNLQQQNLLAGNGFEPYEIPKLVDLAQDKGRVQFFLTSNATSYEGLDHLEPIFKTLQPPIFRSIPIEALVEKHLFKSWMNEFYRGAHPTYDHYLAGEVARINETPQFIGNVKVIQSKVYAYLKYLKMDHLAETIYEKLDRDPRQASDLIESVGELLGPAFDSFPAGRNMNFEAVRYHHLAPFMKDRDVVYPVDSGRFVMEKITVNADSYDGCVNVIENYEQNDLYTVMQSLEKGIKRHDRNSVIESIAGLSEVMDNIWHDANKIKLIDKGIKYGVGITIGVVGAFAAHSLTDLPGLIAGLAGTAGNKLFDAISPEAGQRLMKLANRDYLANIYDFKKKL
jgi:hypothetical protein